MTRERRSYRHFALPMACAAFITTGLATATALAGASGALGALSPAAAARGVVDNELAGDWPASCPYFRPNFYAICLQASSKLDAEHFRLHGSVAVRGTVTQNRTYAQFRCRLFRRRQSQLQRLQPHPVRPGRRPLVRRRSPSQLKDPPPAGLLSGPRAIARGARVAATTIVLAALAVASPTIASPTGPPVTPWPLSLSDMPVGWAVAPPSSGSGSFTRCTNVHDSSAKRHPYHHGQVGFRAGDGIPEVVELLGSWASASVATTTWRTVNAVLSNCHRVTGTDNSKTVVFYRTYPRWGTLRWPTTCPGRSRGSPSSMSSTGRAWARP